MPDKCPLCDDTGEIRTRDEIIEDYHCLTDIVLDLIVDVELDREPNLKPLMKWQERRQSEAA